MDVVFLILGLAALVAGGELVVSHGTRLAGYLRVSPMVIGLTVVAIGTSLPELAVGIDGIRRGVGSMVLGNVVGTDIVNVLLILGLSAVIKPIAVPRESLRIDLPMMTLSSAFLLVLALDGFLTTWDGIAFLVVGVAYMGVVLYTARRRGAVTATLPEDGGAVTVPAADGPRPTRRAVVTAVALLVLGLAVIVGGADVMLRGAVGIAEALGVSETIVGLTIVAIGTSAPELVTTIIATVRGERGLALGNLIGSSTLNITLILGTALMFGPHAIAVDPSLVRLSMPLMVVVGLVCVPVFLTGRRIARREGALFVAGYAGYLGYNIAIA
ncbi:MAG: calcium/sodium antiporter [Promicromonosporaceae bacterium]|nr:calcium/sodium antiporter [Promicromonosporaceae bacterium]